ncbi:hypothetical protein TTHERM_00644700 (macronuclear) [Tetrahymena thermophila SB210]|uniref:Uncharacterized protein n=1 Tax=Tetrahymena thermophila (strain SB210) TaxID=312017 RepID=Q23EW0_TETTS|nr:hypothetical protein TTHERM_00644700 [Tetrahymena thermophila SB210]EAR95145.1 hypothetical protein TTHERM_00644700 [Tetrahymena thermophila SB210]|eukprot:XP_001015390.1 hypothetical protein TTHERM_00644700 [Tetrahymena thermophila SB210]
MYKINKLQIPLQIQINDNFTFIEGFDNEYLQFTNFKNQKSVFIHKFYQQQDRALEIDHFDCKSLSMQIYEKKQRM